MDDDTNDGENEDDGGYLPAHVLERLEDPPEEKKSFRRKYEEPLDFSPPSGSTDPKYAAQDIDVAYYTGRHGYTENATFAKEPIPSTWSDSDRNQLNELNRDFYVDEDKHIQREQRKHDEYNDVISWGKRIGLTETECKYAAYLTTTISSKAKSRYSIEAVILGALTIAANEKIGKRTGERKTIRLDAPQTGHAELVENYEDLRKDLNVDREKVKAVRQAIR